MIEGSLEAKLPTIWTDEKQRWEESEKRRRKRTKEEKIRRKKMQVREKVAQAGSTMFFQGGTKRRLAQAVGKEPCGQMRDGQLHAVFGTKHMPKSKCTKHTCSDHFRKLRR